MAPGVDWPPPTAKSSFFEPPQTGQMGVASGPWGWIGHPQQPNQVFQKIFVWPLGVAGPPQGPPFGRGVASATLDQPAWGGQSHPHGQTVALGGGPATPRAISKKKKKKNYFLKY
jgi:hypothetical protein